MVHMGLRDIFATHPLFSTQQLCVRRFLLAAVAGIVLGVISVGGWEGGGRAGTAEEVINTVSSRVF